MKRTKKSLLCFVGILSSFGISALAQDLQETEIYRNKDMIFIGAEDLDKDSLQAMFVEARELDKRKPSMPSVVFSTRDGILNFAIGGYVKFTTSYDFDGIIDNNDFITNQIPMTSIDGNREQLRMDASKSTLSFKAIANPQNVGKIVTYISADFRAQNNMLDMHNAYISMKGFTMGYTTSTFFDETAEPPTIDFEGPNSMPLIRHTQIRFKHDITNNFSFALAAEMPMFSATYSKSNRSAKQCIPDIPLYFQYSLNNGTHFRASGLFRDLRYYDEITEESENKFGWGAQFSGVANFASKVKFYWMGIYGRGISNYIQDLNGLGLDLVADNEEPGNMKDIPAYSWYAGLRYNFSPTFFCSATYSQVRVDPDKDLETPKMYKFSQYIVGNLFWNVTQNCQMGIEYIYGSKENMADESNHANRAQMMVLYNF